MASRDRIPGVAGLEIVTVSPQAGVHATYVLQDASTGSTKAFIEANHLTVRTAASSA
jgi:ornithine cyclodeaminase/alanine dehydrogenase-like protein (mu-crystallin family)